MLRENIFGECTENVFLSLFCVRYFILFVKNSKIFLSIGCEKKGNTHRYRTFVHKSFRLNRIEGFPLHIFPPLICLKAFSRRGPTEIYLLRNILEKEAMNKLWKYNGSRITLFSSAKD